jgi:NAD(P)-dependent dehydrogenase (short-subunit alcohol dehydrogenase family)
LNTILFLSLDGVSLVQVVALDLTGKTSLITGANSGLGFAVAKRFAAQGADTIMVCRSREKGEKAIDDIMKEHPDATVRLMMCDLSSMESIQRFIEAFKEEYTKLDILYNNAAVMKEHRTVTDDGFEMMFQVNYLAPFILMNSLREQLRNGSSPQIINNGRPSNKLRLDLDDLQFTKKYHMYGSFFETKLCLLFANLEASRRFVNDDISVTMIDPGPFKSDLVRDIKLAGWFKNVVSHSVDTAAENMLYVITLDAKKNGRLYKHREEYPLTEYWTDINVGNQLWSMTESYISDISNIDE